MSSRLIEISKFLSYVLRHKPQAIGLSQDSEGWADIDALIATAASTGRSLDLALIRAVVDGNDKKRFALSDDALRIRAVQGHSTKVVAIQYVAKEPPITLYHGTAKRFLDSILTEGLRPGKRHHVHLSEDKQTAISVGKRYGEPVILTINAKAMQLNNFAFFQADNGVWLTEHVPAIYLEVN